MAADTVEIAIVFPQTVAIGTVVFITPPNGLVTTFPVVETKLSGAATACTADNSSTGVEVFHCSDLGGVANASNELHFEASVETAGDTSICSVFVFEEPCSASNRPFLQGGTDIQTTPFEHTIGVSTTTVYFDQLGFTISDCFGSFTMVAISDSPLFDIYSDRFELPKSLSVTTVPSQTITVTITATLDTLDGATETLQTTLTYDLVNPCETTSFVNQNPDPIDISSDIGSQPVYQYIGEYSNYLDTAGEAYGQGTSTASILAGSSIYTFCGDRTVQLLSPDSYLSLSTYSLTGEERLMLDASALGTLPATYQKAIQISFDAFPLIDPLIVTVNVRIGSGVPPDCDPTVFVDQSPADINMQTTIGESPTTFVVDLNSYTDQMSLDNSPNDGYTFCGAREVAPVDLGDHLTLAGSTLTLEASDPLSLLTTDYSATIAISLATFTNIPPVQVTVQCTLTNECQNTAFATPSDISISHTIGESASVHTLSDQDFQDSSSLAYGSGDGYTFCGPRTFSIQAPSQAPIHIEQGVLVLEEQSMLVPDTTYTDTLLIEIAILGTIVAITTVQVRSTLTNLCQASTFDRQSAPRETVTIEGSSGGTARVPWPQVFDSVSLQNGEMDGIQYCYELRSYVTNDPYLSYEKVSDSLALEIPDDVPETQSYYVHVRVELNLDGHKIDYLTIPVQYTFIGDESSSEQSESDDESDSDSESSLEPYFETEDDTEYVSLAYVGQAWSYELPQLSHPQNKSIEKVVADLGTAEAFISFDQDNLLVTSEAGQTTEADLGQHWLEFVAVDEDGYESPPFVLVMDLISNAPEESLEQEAEEEVEEEAKDEATQEEAQVQEDLEASSAQTASQSRTTSLTVDPSEQERVESSSDLSFRPNAPTVKITSASALGLLKVRFSEKVTIPRASYKYFDQKRRSLEDQDAQILKMLNDNKRNIFQVDYIKNSVDTDEEIDPAGFSWSVDTFDGQNLLIKLEFADLLEVSKSQEKDEVEVSLLEPDFFVSLQGIPLNEGTGKKMKSTLPPQIDGDLAETIQTASMLVGSSTASISAGNFVLNLLIAGSLNSLWQMIESQQLVVLMPMFAVLIPANAAIIFNVLMQVAAFDPVPTEKTTAVWLGLEETGPFKREFEIMGFESYFCVLNLGTQAIIIVIVAVGLCLNWSLCCCRDPNRKIHRFQKRCSRPFKYTFFLRLMRELFLIILICAVVNLYYLKWQSFGQILNSTVALLLVGLVILYPFWIYYVLVRPSGDWNKRKYRQKFGTLFTDLRKKSQTKQTLSRFVTFFYLRRLLLVVTIMWFNQFLVVQFFFFINLLIANVIILNYIKPFAARSANTMEVINEVVVMAVMYHMFAFTDYVPDPVISMKIGYSCIMIISIHILLNLIVILSGSIKQSIHKCKIRYRLRASRQANKEGRGRINGRALSRRLAKRIARKQEFLARNRTEKQDPDPEREQAKSDEAARKQRRTKITVQGQLDPQKTKQVEDAEKPKLDSYSQILIEAQESGVDPTTAGLTEEPRRIELISKIVNAKPKSNQIQAAQQQPQAPLQLQKLNQPSSIGQGSNQLWRDINHLEETGLNHKGQVLSQPSLTAQTSTQINCKIEEEEKEEVPQEQSYQFPSKPALQSNEQVVSRLVALENLLKQTTSQAQASKARLN